MNDRISIGQAGLNGRAHALYRFFDASDVLLYVGITVDPSARFRKHRGDKPWWDDVDHIGIEKFESRELALEAERKAIREENPIHNVVHNEFTTSVAPTPSASDLAASILADELGIVPGDGEYELAVKAAREESEESGRQITDMDVAVVRFIAARNYFACQVYERAVKNLVRALPTRTRDRFVKEVESVYDAKAEDIDFEDLASDMLERLAEDLAWGTLSELPAVVREYWMTFARERSLAPNQGMNASDALRYYRDHAAGVLEQTIDREDRRRRAWTGAPDGAE